MYLKQKVNKKASYKENDDGSIDIRLKAINKIESEKIMKNYTVISKEGLNVLPFLGKNDFKILNQLLNYQHYDLENNTTSFNYEIFKNSVNMPDSRLYESIAYLLSLNLFKIIQRDRHQDSITIMLNPFMLQKMHKGLIQHQQAYDSLPTYKSLREVK